MKEILKSNIWLMAFALCCITFLFHVSIKTGTCIEIDDQSFRAGACEFLKYEADKYEAEQ